MEVYLSLSFLTHALQRTDTFHITPLMQEQSVVLNVMWQATFLLNSKHGANGGRSCGPGALGQQSPSLLLSWLVHGDNKLLD